MYGAFKNAISKRNGHWAVPPGTATEEPMWNNKRSTRAGSIFVEYSMMYPADGEGRDTWLSNAYDIGGYPISGNDPALSGGLYYYKTTGDGKIFEQNVYREWWEDTDRIQESMWTYYINSSVLGVPVAQLDVTWNQRCDMPYMTSCNTNWGSVRKSFAQLGGQPVATVYGSTNSSSDVITYDNYDASGASFGQASKNVSGTITYSAEAELDPRGMDAGRTMPVQPEPYEFMYPGHGFLDTESVLVDGVWQFGRTGVMLMLAHGAADLDGVGTPGFIPPHGILPIERQIQRSRNGDTYYEVDWEYWIYDDFAKLSDDRAKQAHKSLEDLRRFLKDKKNISKDCQENVLDKLKKNGFDLDEFTSYLEKGADIYNGDASTVELGTVLSSDQLVMGPPPAGFTVSDFFAQKDAHGDYLFGALTSGSLSTKRFTAFLSGRATLSKGLMFHEGLHAYGFKNGLFKKGYNDQGLLTALGFASNEKTKRIDEYINYHCFPEVENDGWTKYTNGRHQ